MRRYTNLRLPYLTLPLKATVYRAYVLYSVVKRGITMITIG